MPRILYVTGFPPLTRAKDLAHEFEKYAIPPSSMGHVVGYDCLFAFSFGFFTFTHSAPAIL